MAGEVAGSTVPGTTIPDTTGPAMPVAAGQAEPADATEATEATETTAAARSGWLHPADRRKLIALLIIVVISVGLRLLTWNPIADGAHARYVKTAVFGGFAASAVWLLIRIQTAPLSRLPLV